MVRGRRNYKRQFFFGIAGIAFFISIDILGQTSYSTFSIYEENGSKGIVNSEGKEVIPAKYFDLGWTEGIPEFHQKVIGYRESDKWGLINSDNKIITPPKYHRLFPAHNSNLIVAAMPGRFSGEVFYGLINASGKIAIPFMYAGVEVVDDAVIIKTLDGNKPKYGLVNMGNEPILPFQYEMIRSMNHSLLAVTKPDNRIVLMNTRGKEIIRYEIDSITEIENSNYKIFREGKEGLLDGFGNLLLTPDYKKIDFEPASGKISYLNFNRWDFLDQNQQTKPGLYADELEHMGLGVMKITINNQSWLTDNDLKILSTPFDYIHKGTENHFITSRSTKLGLINNRGMQVLPARFDSLYLEGPFVYCSVNVGDKAEWYVFDTLGIQKSHFIYQGIRPSSEGLIPVKRNNKWGFMTREGVELIHCGFDSVTPFHNNKSVVNLHREEGIIDQDGNWLILPGANKITLIEDSLVLEKSRYQNRLLTMDNELIYFTRNDLHFEGTHFTEKIDSITTWLISLQGTILNTDANRYTPPIPFYDSLLIVHQAGEAGVIAESGLVIIPFGEWDDIYPPSEGFLGIQDDDFYGFIDLDNKLRIANRYEGIGPFNEGLAAVKVRGKWGFIDQKENLVCQPLYQEVDEFTNGLCPVRVDSKWGLIGTDGKLIQAAEYDYMEILDSGFILTSKSDAFGLLNPAGQTILFTKYEELRVLDNGMILIKRKGKYGLFDENGINQIPAIYEGLQFIPERNEFFSMTSGVWETIDIPR